MTKITSFSIRRLCRCTSLSIAQQHKQQLQSSLLLVCPIVLKRPPTNRKFKIMVRTQPTYQILACRSTAAPYFKELMPIVHRIINGENITKSTNGTPGKYFQQSIATNFSRLKATGLPDDFVMLQCLLNTKKPQIFAESAVVGHGTADWNPRELDILGDIGIAVPVTIYDNGRHRATLKDVHKTPFEGTLLYVPGLLFANGQGQPPCDFDKAAFVDPSDGQPKIDEKKFCKVYERRLVPSLLYANAVCEQSNKQGFITIPGLGCGQFAGPFNGQLGKYLQAAIHQILHQHHSKLPYIKAVYFDPYQECKNAQYEIGHIKYLVRPLSKNKNKKPQLSHPSLFEEGTGDDYANCHLFSFVAWDHVSWPGNDFWKGSRGTDDGVKAAATSTMYEMTGIEGKYDTSFNEYLPPSQFGIWEEVVKHYNLEIQVTQDNLHIF